MAQIKRRTKTRGASRTRATTKRPLPAWLWLLGGVVIGGFITLLLQLRPAHVGLEKMAEQAQHNEQKKGKKNYPKPVFDFYTKLAENQETDTGAKENEKIKSKPEANQKNADLSKVVKISTPSHYILQAGSFRNLSDADSLRAKLLLMGLKVHISKVQVASGDSWHRVQVGPFPNQTALLNAKKVLEKNHIRPLLLKMQ